MGNWKSRNIILENTFLYIELLPTLNIIVTPVDILTLTKYHSLYPHIEDHFHFWWHQSGNRLFDSIVNLKSPTSGKRDFFSSTAWFNCYQRWRPCFYCIATVASFDKLSHPFPHHWVTQELFNIHFTNLKFNFSSRQILCIQKPNTYALFTRGGSFNLYEHYRKVLLNVCTAVLCDTDFSDFTTCRTTRSACSF